MAGKKQLYFDVRDSCAEEGKIPSGDLPSASGCTEIERIACSKGTVVRTSNCAVQRHYFLHVTRVTIDFYTSVSLRAH